MTYTAATVLIAGGIAVTALSGGTLTVGGVALAGLGMGLISAGVSVGMMTYNQMETQNCITASVGDYLKTASLSFATGFVSGTVGAVTGGITSSLTGSVFTSATAKYAVNFGLETLGDAFVQKVTTGEVNWKQAVVSGALDTVIGASVDGVTAIVKNWDSVKYSAKSIWTDETGAIEIHKTINGLNVINGKVDGKIPVKEYFKYRNESIHNTKSDIMTLGKFRPTINADGSQNWNIAGPDSYTVRAGNTTYFSLGSEWDKITKKYHLDSAGNDMFKLFNVPALDDAVKANKTIRFSHDPNLYKNSALEKEWSYLKINYGYTDLIKKGDFWYAIR